MRLHYSIHTNQELAAIVPSIFLIRTRRTLSRPLHTESLERHKVFFVHEYQILAESSPVQLFHNLSLIPDQARKNGEQTQTTSSPIKFISTFESLHAHIDLPSQMRLYVLPQHADTRPISIDIDQLM